MSKSSLFGNISERKSDKNFDAGHAVFISYVKNTGLACGKSEIQM